MSDNVPILTCQFCGNKTPMKILNEYYRETIAPLKYNEKARLYDSFVILECPVCIGFQMVHVHWNSEEYIDISEDKNIYDDATVLFPQNEKLELYYLPSGVKSAYESAFRVKNIDNTTCVMALRRTLEMLCKDKGAVNGQLHQKLNQLKQKGILPPLMGDISKVIKDFGNMAAHGDQITFDRNMVNSMFRFTNKLLEYVYILPNEIQRAKYDLDNFTDTEDSHNIALSDREEHDYNSV